MNVYTYIYVYTHVCPVLFQSIQGGSDLAQDTALSLRAGSDARKMDVNERVVAAEINLRF